MVHESIYDCIVVGGGHAGAEAALALARTGHSTLLLTLHKHTICQMSCNPAIGGLAKGQMVREIDALGGEMAKAIDATGIQFRMLNCSRGPAVWSPRAQADKHEYHIYMRRHVENTPRLDIREGEAAEVVVENGEVKGVKDAGGAAYYSRAVILTTGTFLKGLIHIGEDHYEAGRRGEEAAKHMSSSLIKNGIVLERFKTGTPPRVDRSTVDHSGLEEHPGDENPQPFSYQTAKIKQPQVSCYMTHTNETTHKIIRDNLHHSALYSGRIKGIGPRYCPSIEDKVVKFSEKKSHQLYLEPEGREVKEIYINGLSMSLPEPIQNNIVRTIKGLEESTILLPAYAIEYDYSPPTQIHLSYETRAIKNLFLAGQINGTSGYEEAAAQGLLAAFNVIRKLKNEAPFILDRTEAYAGVMIDDLVTRGTNEPYRMFTSRAEFRLLLRQDNADERLMRYGYEFGLIPSAVFERFIKKNEAVQQEIKRLKTIRNGPKHLDILVKRPSGSYKSIPEHNQNKRLSSDEINRVELTLKYEGYLKRQHLEAKKFKKLEGYRLSDEIDYLSIIGITREAKEKLIKYKPASIGQASRIPGITACDLSVLMVNLDKINRLKTPKTT